MVTYIWSDNSIVKQVQIQAINVTSIEAELMAIHIGLIPAIENDNIIIITDSISAASKILESKVNPLQNMVIPLASAIKLYFSRDSRNKVQFWYCSSKAKWPRHQLVDNQVKASTNAPEFSYKNLHLLSRKKECDDVLHEWQSTFVISLKKGHYFLKFKDEDKQVIKPHGSLP